MLAVWTMFVYTALPIVSIAVGIAYLGDVKILRGMGKERSPVFARGIALAAIGFGIEDLWWGAYFALVYHGQEAAWMLNAKPFLTIAALTAAYGYYIHLKGHEITRPGLFTPTRVFSVACLCGLLVALI